MGKVAVFGMLAGTERAQWDLPEVGRDGAHTAGLEGHPYVGAPPWRHGAGAVPSLHDEPWKSWSNRREGTKAACWSRQDRFEADKGGPTMSPRRLLPLIFALLFLRLGAAQAGEQVWYLLRPPLTEDGPSRPLTEWEITGAYDSRAQCAYEPPGLGHGSRRRGTLS